MAQDLSPCESNFWLNLTVQKQGKIQAHKISINLEGIIYMAEKIGGGTDIYLTTDEFVSVNESIEDVKKMMEKIYKSLMPVDS